ncbi:MAG: hypothetical protein PF692_13605 [Kiritimatiellae bacterium]|jgi:hypothetical protein|nr:hypothetical protein [Kiritimatiellia bacterium]
MYLEDVMLTLYVDVDNSDSNVSDFCAQAINGGIDMIVAAGTDLSAIKTIADVCMENDALLSLTDINMFENIQADCFLNMSNEISIGQAASILCNGEKNGKYVATFNEALMATEVGVDFLFFQQNFPNKSALVAIETSIPIYVGRIKTLEKAREFAGSGIIRMLFDMKDYDGSMPVTDYYAEVSKLIGRTF